VKTTRHTPVSEKLQRRDVLIQPSRSPTSNISAWLRNKTVWKVAFSLIVPHPLRVPLHNSAKLISQCTPPLSVQGVHNTVTLELKEQTSYWAVQVPLLFRLLGFLAYLFALEFLIILIDTWRFIILIDTWRFIMLIDIWRFIILIDTWRYIILALGAL